MLQCSELHCAESATPSRSSKQDLRLHFRCNNFRQHRASRTPYSLVLSAGDHRTFSVPVETQLHASFQTFFLNVLISKCCPMC
jgi:hypothetical protein